MATRAAGRGRDVLSRPITHRQASRSSRRGGRSRRILLSRPGGHTDGGHANCVGAIGWIDFTRSARPWQAAATSAAAGCRSTIQWEWDCDCNAVGMGRDLSRCGLDVDRPRLDRTAEWPNSREAGDSGSDFPVQLRR